MAVVLVAGYLVRPFWTYDARVVERSRLLANRPGDGAASVNVRRTR